MLNKYSVLSLLCVFACSFAAEHKKGQTPVPGALPAVTINTASVRLLPISFNDDNDTWSVLVHKLPGVAQWQAIRLSAPFANIAIKELWAHRMREDYSAAISNATKQPGHAKKAYYVQDEHYRFSVGAFANNELTGNVFVFVIVPRFIRGRDLADEATRHAGYNFAWLPLQEFENAKETTPVGYFTDEKYVMEPELLKFLKTYLPVLDNVGKTFFEWHPSLGYMTPSMLEKIYGPCPICFKEAPLVAWYPADPECSKHPLCKKCKEDIISKGGGKATCPTCRQHPQ